MVYNMGSELGSYSDMSCGEVGSSVRSSRDHDDGKREVMVKDDTVHNRNVMIWWHQDMLQ